MKVDAINARRLEREEPPPNSPDHVRRIFVWLVSATSQSIWEPGYQRISCAVSGFCQIFIVTCASLLVTPAFSAAAFNRRTREKTAGTLTQSNVSESLVQVNFGKAAHSRKYWNSITSGHLSHITCSVSICILLFWGKHGLTDSTHLRFLQLPSVHEVFGCSYRKRN